MAATLTSPPPVSSPLAQALTNLLDQRAKDHPERLAYRFLSDGEQSESLMDFQALRQEARSRAASLLNAGAAGQPVLLIEPPGLGFITGLFACWYAGAIAVPAYPPRGKRHRQRLEAILHDSGARLSLGGDPDHPLTGITRVENSGRFFDAETPESDGPCLLQYTSGSTARPKGVVLHHHHLRHHLAALAGTVKSLHIRSALSWLPPYHDMGLVLKLLLSVDAGFPLTFFSPDHFVQRPVRWLRAISRHRAEFSGGPNSAFELCLRSVRDEDLAGLDLSCWKAAPCGAERVHADTLQRFARRFASCGFNRDAFLPGYGLAEATLTVSACRPGRGQKISRHPTVGSHVSCGPALEGNTLRIADPNTGRTLPDGEVGEIRVKGPGIAAGYWQRPEESAAVFMANGELLTGDRGYLNEGELYVIGRLKDLIILDGINHAPEDIEAALTAAFPEFPGAAAFPQETPSGDGVVLAIESGQIPATALAALAIKVRQRLADDLEIPLHRLLFVRAGTLPRTTSGKIRRGTTREAFEKGRLILLFDDANVLPHVGAALDRVLDAVREVSGREGARAEDDLVSFGLSSIEATRLAALLQAATGIGIPLGELFAAPSFAHVAALLESRSAKPLPEIVPGSGASSGILTHSQERMWFLHQLDPDSAAYHVFGALELEGTLDIAALENAYAAVTGRHPILRSRHLSHDGQPVVILSDETPPRLEHAAGDADTVLRDFALRPFDLESGSPVRALLLSTGSDRHLFALCAHHIAADGWSVRVIVQDLAAHYTAFATGRELPPPLSGPDYLDYAAWHRRNIDGGAADRQIDYWKSRLAGHSGIMDLPTDFPRPVRASSADGAVVKDLPAPLATRIAALAKSRRATPFMVQLAAFLLMLRRHGADDGPVVAVPVANRHHPATGDLVGTLVNTLPFRLTLDSEETFHSLLERVRDASFEMQDAQDAPFERIIEAVRPERARDRSPLAQVMFDHQELPIPESWHGGLRCRPHLAHRGAVQFDLSLLCFVLSDRQQVVLEYRADLFRHETAAAMLDRYLATLEEVCREPGRPIRSISGLAEGDLVQLLTVGEGPDRPDFLDRTTAGLIAETCRRLSKATALVCGDEALDYRDLDNRASTLAASLQRRGVMPGDRIALLLERDLLLPVALLAAWKAGAAYVPLDAANPPERLALILADQSPLHVLVSPGLIDRLPEGTDAIVLEPAMADGTDRPAVPPVQPSDAAYILYTSGSTGKPKGVVVSHGALANFLLSMREEPGFREGQRLLALTTVSFDISALEIFLPLVAGGTVDLVVGKTARDPVALADRIATTRPDVMQATPATWRMLLDTGWEGSPGMAILCGGEAMDLELARKLRPLGRQLWNLYGPTETTVWSTLWQVPENPQRIGIGQPIANTRILIAAEDGTPLPPGIPGELFISGAGLAEGYWQRPELTAERFVEPVLPRLPRYYRTGDLARWLPDGTLECLGRSDGQVKVRGFRVELGEIDATLLSHVGVAEAATVLAGERLVAWYRPVFPGLDPAEILDHLRARLPDYMVPSPLVALDHLPLSSSGKIDRRALAARPLPESAAAPALSAADPLARELAAIWGDILECHGVGVDDDFFALGGHSLAAARLVSEVARRTGITVPLDWLFDQPTPSGMAERMREKAAVDLAEPRVIPLSRGHGGRPLFWCHTLVDGGMGLLPYRETARLLGSITDSQGIAEGTRSFGSIAEMADAHIAKIRAVQPHGPYRLAGFCFGGNLAAEVAARLDDQGEEIELLCLLESSPPLPAEPGINPWLRPATWGRFLSRLPARLRSLMARDSRHALRRLKMKHRAAGSLLRGDGIPDIRGVLDLDLLDSESQDRAERHWQALHLHIPRLPAARRIVLVRAEDDGWLPRPATLGWKSRTRIEVLKVPGCHEDFLRQHSATEVAQVLRQVLRG